MDQAELAELMQKHHVSAWGWTLHCCEGNRDEAEEVLQTVYLGILEGRMSFEGRSSFRTWLFSVLRKTAMKRRMQLLRRLEKLKERFWKTESTAAECEERIYGKEIGHRIRRMLANLSERQRQVLQLVFYHDLTIEEAAHVLGVAVGSARTHYERGKSRLRLEMEKAGLNHDGRTGRLGSKTAV